MEKPKKQSLKNIGKNLTSTISVALVLLILGIVGSMAVATRNVTNSIKENLGFNLILTEEATEAQINAIKQRFNSAPYISSYDFMSAEEILRQEEIHLGADIVEMLGVNPYQPEFNIKVKADYANTDSLTKIVSPFEQMAEVAEVTVHAQMVDDINSNINTITIVLLAVAVALLLISFVLINNTVRLTIYSRRFILHTMRLVGATGSFIRRPIVISNVINGLIAGVLGILLLVGLRYYAATLEAGVKLALPWNDFTFIFIGMLIGGMIICGLASIFATNKYLRRKYDDMF